MRGARQMSSSHQAFSQQANEARPRNNALCCFYVPVPELPATELLARLLAGKGGTKTTPGPGAQAARRTNLLLHLAQHLAQLALRSASVPATCRLLKHDTDA